jgi:tripartite-type tricarboxylate transporter receptor subunit TctC
MQAIALKLAGVALLASAMCASSAHAADPVSFAGKQIQFLIGTGAGDTYDSYSRLLGKFLTKHLPGAPVVVPSNRAGAGSLVAVNATYNSQVRDGSMLVMGQRFVPLMPLLGLPGAQFDPTKMAYIGSISSETSVCVAHERSGVARLEDARKQPLIVGTMGAGTELTNFTATINKMLGIEFQVVRGYGSSGEIDLAIDRGELQGRCGVSYSSLMRTRGDWVSTGKVKIFLQIDVTRSREMPNVPSLGELVNDVDRAALRLLTAPGAIARPVFGPPDTQPERLAALRKAFDDVMADKDFLQEARRQQLEIAPMSGAAMEGLIKELYASDPKVIERARGLANGVQ